ncbi:RHS repeat domain-containing protein [Vibrio ostreae]|uniref:RHS repeat-associated core domain-containing protein n=1 Tax=Vibrio ostreae TaxID=2841925 RepID=A0A975YMH8_9VIBR|nr:RHS repeat-associated core domain-containing protein [Vibrio ostreae]QXO16516.1 hypothetical protein KNV97_01895 [Vibrio ostreae]
MNRTLYRYYDADSGQYLSSDPIGMLGGLRPQAYVHNPMEWVDPLGLYSELKHTGMGHHLIPRSVAKKLAIDDFAHNQAISWYPNNVSGSDELHKRLHCSLINEGVPFHGSKFEASVGDFFQRAKSAYDGIDEKGFLKVPYTDEILADDVTPKEALEILEQRIVGLPKHE